MSSVYILNFTVPSDPQELLDYFEKYGGTNIDALIEDFKSGETN